MEDSINERMQKIKNMIESLINENRLDEAKDAIKGYENVVNDDVDVYSMKAVIAIMEGKIDDARCILLKGLGIDNNNFDILYNLGYVYEQLGNCNEAIRYYNDSMEVCIDEDLKDNIASIIENIKLKYGDLVKESRPRVAFFVKYGMDNFLGDIIECLSTEYETRKIIVTEYTQIDEGMRWADICWFEWCDELVIYGSKLELAEKKKIVCRLHRYEALTEYPKNVMWKNIDKLIIVTNHLKRILNSQMPGIEKMVDIVTIENGVNLDKYKLKEREKGFNIAYVGYIHQRKNPALLLQIINKLVTIDKRYKLYIAGQFQDPLVELYWNYQVEQMGLKNNIIFEGWQNNINDWLEDKNYIISSSMHESFGYGIAESMSRGIKPVIHNFLFANEIWDKKYLFNTIDEAVNMILSSEYNSQEYRKFIEDNYSLKKQMLKIKEILISETKNSEKLNIKMENRKVTLDYICNKFNEFIGYRDSDFDNYDFESADIIIGKRERVSKTYEMIEFILRNKEGKNLVLNNIWYNPKNKEIILSEQMKRSRKINYIIDFVKRVVELNVEFKNNIAGFVFDKDILQDISKNSLAYNWERAVPASQFMPMLGYLRIAERYTFAAKFIRSNDRVLESPCGFGYGASYLSKICSHVEALDIAEDNIKFGKDTYGLNNINWMIGDVTHLPYKDNEFDVCVSYEVFEHLSPESIGKYLDEAKRVIKEGGKFIISTPNREMRKNINNPFHIKEYNFYELDSILKRCFENIAYYSVVNFKVEEGFNEKAVNMIAVCSNSKELV
jgi:glycosyltransferase involved in cell wall biosynthesis/ubiquinone/menaquinone biosynthesis C-methylase UbiE